MKKTTLFAGLMLAGLIAAPIASVSTNDNAAPSYALKKQGRVHFQANQETTDANAPETAENAMDTQDPASIEPAAGGFEPAPESQNAPSLADDMKLPRK